MISASPSASIRVSANGIPKPANHPQFQGSLQKEAPQKKPPQRGAYESPRPQPWVIAMLNPINDYVILQGIPVLKQVPLLNRLRPISGLTGIKQIDLPAADLNRLKQFVNSETIAFLGPNHPEFFTDWMIDKKISSLAAPEMSSWADAGLVNGSAMTKRLFLANNLIANNGREQAKADSIRSALQGKGTLLHPEGRVWWNGDKIRPIFPGIVEMSVEAVKQTPDSQKPVYIVPIVSKFHFPTDVSQGLHRDMAALEKKLGLPVENKQSVGERFFKLQESMLGLQEKRFGLPETKKKLSYFQRQQRLQNFLTEKLEAKYGSQPGATGAAKLQLLERAVAKAQKADPAVNRKQDALMLKELFRLEGFSPEIYNRPSLTQEHLYETIKRSLQIFAPGFNTMVPQPPGHRIAHIRVAEPINVRERVSPDMSPEAQKALVSTLSSQVQTVMQDRLDALSREIEPETRQYQIKNQFYTAQPDWFKARL